MIYIKESWEHQKKAHKPGLIHQAAPCHLHPDVCSNSTSQAYKDLISPLSIYFLALLAKTDSKSQSFPNEYLICQLYLQKIQSHFSKPRKWLPFLSEHKAKVIAVQSRCRSYLMSRPYWTQPPPSCCISCWFACLIYFLRGTI